MPIDSEGQTPSSRAARRGRLVRALSRWMAARPNAPDYLATLIERERPVPAGLSVVTRGEAARTVTLLLEGWAVRHRSLRDGRRQVVGFVLPGDLLDVNAMLGQASSNGVDTLTDVVLGEIDPVAFVRTCHSHPELAIGQLRALERERAMLVEHAARIGRRPATERIAHLLAELACRLQRLRMVDGPGGVLPLTQELIADAVGLSAVHVNRVMARLRAAGQVRVHRGEVVVADWRRLAQTCGFDPAHLGAPFEQDP